jgi:CRP-like cAMP-binding protein
MKPEHMNICRAMTLVYFKPNEVIVKQGDPGDSFFYILSGTVKIMITKQIDLGLGENGDKMVKDVYIAF